MKQGLLLTIFLACIGYSIICFASYPVITDKDLLPGDLIFWAQIDANDRAGHVAIVTQTGSSLQQLRVAHATDHPKYQSFVETYLPPSHKISQNNKRYFVIRLQSPDVRKRLNTLIQTWLTLKIPFNFEHEKIMNRWDDAMPTLNSSTKVKLQRIIYAENTRSKTLPHDGLMCSEILIEALQRTIKPMPQSLKLDPISCPPSTFMVSLMQDKEVFLVLGILEIPDFQFAPAEKAKFERTFNTEHK